MGKQTDGGMKKPYLIGHFWLLLWVQKAKKNIRSQIRGKSSYIGHEWINDTGQPSVTLQDHK